ncbi:hypothetical protein [Leptospira kirschneri]|uniref:Lipoprotein n=1 Tax=Leptospira kirschneri str. H1 TaxID=1049966 RepID=A0A0E2AY59_9LEPT|nr:hypothetical protein [Leptospira kirschneri]EKO13786.1 hypothetical protein LEP1GSC081_3094 [Leptospira kirschneri str. H1]UML80403.1 hypothetical protein FH602_19505 [Leptospira kirschneri]
MKKNLILFFFLAVVISTLAQCSTVHFAKVSVFDKDKIVLHRNFCPTQGCGGSFDDYIDDYICVVEKNGDLTCNDVNEKYKNPSIIKEAY